jgi:hypothetical protein
MLPEVVGGNSVKYMGFNSEMGVSEIAKQCVPAVAERMYHLAMTSDNLQHVTGAFREFTDRAYGKAKDTIRIEDIRENEAVAAVRTLIRDGVLSKTAGEQQLRDLGIVDVDFTEN